jgi:acid stress-induced BolA-like protein IbaG/YrbA
VGGAVRRCTVLGFVPTTGMSDHPTDFVGSVEDAITTAVKQRIPDSLVAVSGGGGHYRIDVVSTVFAGKSMLENQRLVLGAIKHLINGNSPPVHAVDSLTTRTPG